MRFKLKDRTQWHRWFAWRPVFVGDEIVWLETVMRRDDGFWAEFDDDYVTVWKYRHLEAED